MIQDQKMLDYIKAVLDNTPSDWLNLTTHRLDIYNEKLAKVQFLEQFESLFTKNKASESVLDSLPTAFDYIRLGHPLSCILEWVIAKRQNVNPNQVISFSSQTMPTLAVLRKNLLDNKKTQIFYEDELPPSFNSDLLREIYGYQFDLQPVENIDAVSRTNGSSIFITTQEDISHFEHRPEIDFYINIKPKLGSVILLQGDQNNDYISAIQHVRRRETIAMTPANCLKALQTIVGQNANAQSVHKEESKKQVVQSIQEITDTSTNPLVASSGLSIQYAILMGLIHDANERYSGKPIKIVVPPNCYGGTNDQARRVAACIDHVEIVDLPVDGDNDMVQSVELVLKQIAREDAIPYIIAEIPTNPRVEVPNLELLKNALARVRKTREGNIAVEPVFILDQTFCPNVQFLGTDAILSSIRTISFSSGSKFPSGGLCTAGYCTGNEKAISLMEKIKLHLTLCDNEATDLQYKILAEQMPSMLQRVHEAYLNTREFVNFIKETLPDAKINFVTEELAAQGFTPSVFSMDLPTKGDTDEEREAYKRALNLKLINRMITEIPNESKFCVSYGQLKGCYWTIPATSTQGTTKEGDKDYIVRTSLSPQMDLELHKKVFLEFVENM